MSFLAHLAGDVTVRVEPSAVAEVASSADIAEVAPSADLAEMASSADLAEVASSADLAEMASSADLAEVASSADLAGDVTVGVTSLADPDCVVTAGVAFREEWGNSVVIPSHYVCHYDDIAEVASSADLAGDVTVGVTSLADPVVGDSVMIQSGSVWDDDDYYDNRPDYFDYDDPCDYDNYPGVDGYVWPDNYELYHDLHGPDDCGVYCVSRGDVGVVPYWSGDEEGDVYEGDVALPWTGSDEPANSVVSMFGPGGHCDEEGDVYVGDVALPRTGSDEPVK